MMSILLQHGNSAYWEACVRTSVRRVRRLHVVVRSRHFPNIAPYGADQDKTKGIQQSQYASKPTFSEVCLPRALLLSKSPRSVR